MTHYDLIPGETVELVRGLLDLPFNESVAAIFDCRTTGSARFLVETAEGQHAWWLDLAPDGNLTDSAGRRWHVGGKSRETRHQLSPPLGERPHFTSAHPERADRQASARAAGGRHG